MACQRGQVHDVKRRVPEGADDELAEGGAQLGRALLLVCDAAPTHLMTGRRAGCKEGGGNACVMRISVARPQGSFMELLVQPHTSWCVGDPVPSGMLHQCKAQNKQVFPVLLVTLPSSVPRLTLTSAVTICSGE